MAYATLYMKKLYLNRLFHILNQNNMWRQLSVTHSLNAKNGISKSHLLKSMLIIIKGNVAGTNALEYALGQYPNTNCM